MKRLLQALSSKFFAGDLIQNTLNHRYTAHKIYTVVECNRRGREEFVTYQADLLNITFPGPALRKLKRKTFGKEWRKLFGTERLHEIDEPKTLEQLCQDKNIGYLYKELQASKTIEQFQTTTLLINKMLNNGIRSI